MHKPDSVHRKSRLSSVLIEFLEAALKAIEPPLMKFLIILVMTIPLFLLLQRNVNPNLSFVLFVVVILSFAFLVGLLQRFENRSEYSERTLRALKSELREVVAERDQLRVTVAELKIQLASFAEHKDTQTESAASTTQLKITYIEYDPPGHDFKGEFVRLENQGSVPIQLTDWTLEDSAHNRFTFPACTLAPGEYIRVWTGIGQDTLTDLHWGRTQGVWNNDGDCAQIYNAVGKFITSHCYRQL